MSKAFAMIMGGGASESLSVLTETRAEPALPFAGKYRIVYFGYTYCPDVCPTDMARIGAAMKLLDKDAPAVSAKVVPIFITVDPVRDTPAVLKQFVANFHPRVVGLTGTPTPDLPPTLPEVERTRTDTPRHEPGSFHWDRVGRGAGVVTTTSSVVRG